MGVGPEDVFDGLGGRGLGADYDGGGGEEEDSVADSLLMAVDGVGGAAEEVYDSLALFGVQHVEIQQDALAAAEVLDDFQGLFERAGFDDHYFAAGGGAGVVDYLVADIAHEFG